MAPINIRGNIIDPANLQDVVLPDNASNTDYVLVQLDREMDSDILTALVSHGADIIKRMVGNTWLLHYPPEDLRILETVPGVAHALVYADIFVVHRDLRNDNSEGSSDNRQDVTIVLHENARGNADGALADIQNQGNNELLSSYKGIFKMMIDPADFDRLAALDSVQAIEATAPVEPHNNLVKEISGINSINEDLTRAKKPILRGTGQFVALSDSGVDLTHPAFQNRVENKYYVTGNETDEGAHGTHVAGTILGGPMTSWDNKDCSGMAPEARLCVQGGLFRDKGWQAQELFDKAYRMPNIKCRIHNNSWGYSYVTAQGKNLSKYKQAAYTSNDAEPVDQFALQQPDYFICFSAGNDGNLKTDTGAQVGGWGCAKNVLTVGATYNNRPMKEWGNINYKPEPAVNKKDEDIYRIRTGSVVLWSSRGPCKGSQRNKPDVVAPGIGILSARSASGSKKAIEDFEGWGKPPDGFNANDKTIFCSGTSMSAPAVSGYAALLREALAKWQGMATPSAPLMKALFINGTNIIEGVPKTVQGFGQVNMPKVLRPVKMNTADIASGKAASGWVQGVVDTNKDTQATKAFQALIPQASNAATNLKVTLVYHDRPGDQIQNKMNLYIDRTGQTRLNSLPAMEFDNVHQLTTPVVKGETVTIGVETRLILPGAEDWQRVIPWSVVWDTY